MYAQLENWRLSEEKRIMTTTRQASRLRSARAKLVTDEALKLAQLANKRDKNKLAHKQDIVKSIILKVSKFLSEYSDILSEDFFDYGIYLYISNI